MLGSSTTTLPPKFGAAAARETELGAAEAMPDVMRAARPAAASALPNHPRRPVRALLSITAPPRLVTAAWTAASNQLRHPARTREVAVSPTAAAACGSGSRGRERPGDAEQRARARRGRPACR